MSDNESNTIL